MVWCNRQGADQEQTAGLERIMTEHPETHTAIGQLVECAHRRVITAEAKNETLVQHVEKSKPEQELYERMRALQRDSSNTQNFHFEQQSNAVSENANHAGSSKEEPSKKRSRVDEAYTSGLSAIAAAMQRTIPPRPRNIHSNEQFRGY